MATIVPIHVNTDGGGDFSSLGAAWAAEGAGYNFASNKVIKKFILSGAAADPTYNLLISATTSSQYYPWFYCDPMDPAGRHPDYYSEAHWRMESNSYSGLMRIRCDCLVDGLQGKNTYTSGSPDGPGHGFCADEVQNGIVIVQNCILWKDGAANNPHECIGVGAKNMYYNSYTFVARKNIIFGDWDDALFGWVEPGLTQNLYIYNNTTIDAIVNGFYYDRNQGGGANPLLYYKNNLHQNSGSADYNDNGGSDGTLVSATNITGDSTSPDGASYQSKSLTFENAGSDDYRLSSSDTVAIDAGTDLSTLAAAQYPFSDDAQGRAITTFDIGAPQYQAPGTVVSAEAVDLLTIAGRVTGSLS